MRAKKSLICGLCVLGMSSLYSQEAPVYEWMPEEAEHAGSGRIETAGPVYPVVYTQIPKITSDLSKFTKRYVLELQKFGIRNDGTQPVETTAGINHALQHAKAIGANHIVFPKGVYLIDEKSTIVFDHKNTVVDFNGATLRINPNAQLSYTMVKVVNGAENLRLTNGIFQGDRDQHDYKTNKGPHEGCTLLDILSGVGLEVDHIEFRDAPGFCVGSGSTGAGNRDELLKMLYHWVYIKDLQSGAFSEKGEPIADSTKTRTSKPYDISKVGGEFEFGWTEGYMGFPFIFDRNYQVVFFDKDMRFIEKQRHQQFRKVTVPDRAHFVHLEFNQPEVSTEPAHHGGTRAGHCGRISNFKTPRDVHFHHNRLINNRALGMAFCGGIRWIIEDNHFERNGGQAPSFAVDFEDGWELMQSVVFRNNTFKDNHNDLVVCAGSELLFEGNHFEKTVIIYGRAYNYHVQKNIFKGSRITFATRSGVLQIHDNQYVDNSVINLSFDNKGIADGAYHDPSKARSIPSIKVKGDNMKNVAKLTGGYFQLLECNLDNVNIVAGKETGFIAVKDSQLRDVTLQYEATGPAVTLVEENNKGRLKISGQKR
jgi:hypothetical protein